MVSTFAAGIAPHSFFNKFHKYAINSSGLLQIVGARPLEGRAVLWTSGGWGGVGWGGAWINVHVSLRVGACMHGWGGVGWGGVGWGM